jgi:hypothetical protein
MRREAPLALAQNAEQARFVKYSRGGFISAL